MPYKHTHRLRLALAVCLCAVTMTSVARAPRDEPQGNDDSHRSHERHENRHGHDREDMEMDEAVSRAQRQSGGRVLTVDPDERGSYRVKVLTPEGHVRTLRMEDEQ